MRVSNKIQVILGLGFIVALVTARFFVFEQTTVPQNGMYPAIARGSRVWVNKLAYFKPADVKRGDIVVYNFVEAGQNYKYIWRVVGLPGESIHTKDHELSINGSAVLHQYLRTDGDQKIFLEKLPDCQYEICFESSAKQLPPETAVTLGPDEFFLLGDNRDSAADNRYKGPVRFRSLIGRKL